MKFKDLVIGDYFATKVGRYVVIRECVALCVISVIDSIGEEHSFKDNQDVVPLYTTLGE